MPGLSTLALAHPWLLIALAALPALWWLLRVTPPAAQRVRFPAVRLLLGLTPREETASRTPWWLLLLRLTIAGLLILGLADPVLHPASKIGGSGPLVMVVDDDWAAGATWQATGSAVGRWLDRAERSGKRVILLTTAPDTPDAPIEATPALRPPEARRRVNALRPRPWPRDLQAAAEAVAGLNVDGSARAVWFTNGLDGDGARTLASRLQRLGSLTVVQPPAAHTAKVIRPPDPGAAALTARVRRAAANGAETVRVDAVDTEGRVISTTTATFAADARSAGAAFDLPLSLRNRVARVRLRGSDHAGATALFDGRWQRRRIGIVGPSGSGVRPLVSPQYYLKRAVQPFAETRRAPLPALLKRDLSVLMLPDRGRLADRRRRDLEAWVRDGGVLVRFAGPELAASLADSESANASGAAKTPLLPVTLRRGGRTLGGAMTWDEPARIADFPETGPLAGLPQPRDVRVRKQVLARPGPGLADHTWARLADGTPLVTGARRGDGWIVFVHTAADASWSNLPLSGTFVRILRRVTQLGAGVDGTAESPLPPVRLIDGFGELVPPYGAARPLPADPDASPGVTPAHPPGLYGRAAVRRAHNLGPAVGEITPLTDLPTGVVRRGLAGEPTTHLGPWLLGAALALLLLDGILAMALRGLLPVRARRAAVSTVLAAAAVAAAASNAHAQAGDDTAYAQKAALETRLAYIETGIPEVDRTSRLGLAALSNLLSRRTSVEPKAPMAADPAEDPLVVFPMLYWPVTPRQDALSDQAADKLTRFLKSGGTLIIDLRDAAPGLDAAGGGSPSSRALRRLTRDIPIPPLTTVGSEHVLTKTFYLLQTFPGRTAGGKVWVENTERTGSEVASVIIGGNDWAGAWARDSAGDPLHAVTPGGPRQRETAYRVGVNLVMYALTGTYKADQVHVRAILERLER